MSISPHQQAEDQRRRVLIFTIIAVAIALVTTAVLWYSNSKPEHQAASAPPPSTTMPTGTASVQPSAPHKVTKPRVDCTNPPNQAFVPTKIVVTGITKGSPVLALPRDKDGVPGVPPIDSRDRKSVV